MRRFVLACLIASTAALLPAAPAQIPGNNTSAGPIATSDPATATFSTSIGLMLVAVKPDKAADYESAIVALQNALSKAEDADTRAMAQGWRVYKAVELDAKTNVLYVHIIQPVNAETDYRPSVLLDKLLSGAPADLLAKYRDAFAAAPTKLALSEFAHMAVAPVAKPGNASPSEPSRPPMPRNGSP